MAPQTSRCLAHHGPSPERDRSGHCSACRCERKRRERHERRAIANRIRDERGCEHCAGTEGLHFHHRDPGSKTATVAYMVRWGTERMLAEIAKCDVLCSACHLDHHYPNRPMLGMPV